MDKSITELDPRKTPTPSRPPQKGHVSHVTLTTPHRKGVTFNAILSLRLANPALTLGQAAKVLGCSAINIRKHLARHGMTWGTLHKELDDYKKTEADLLAIKTRQMLESIKPSEIKEMSVHNRVVDAGILIDKRAILTGKSTAQFGVQIIVQGGLGAAQMTVVSDGATSSRPQTPMDPETSHKIDYVQESE